MNVVLIPRVVILSTIRLYQKTLSIDHGIARFLVPSQGRCKFYPTCSEYGYQAIERFGVMRGGLLAMRRVLRCHPFSKGGVDDLPNE